MIIDEKCVLITGGTGSFGYAVVNRLLSTRLRRFVFSAATKRSRRT